MERKLTGLRVKIMIQPKATARISIMIPTRKRVGQLRNSINSLIDTASSVDGIDLLVAVDNDDTETIDYIGNELIPYLNEKNVMLRSYNFNRLGYRNLHLYANYLVKESRGEWIILWNDDAIMKTENWDEKIMEYTGQFKVLRFKDNHNSHPNAIFPCVPRDWVVLFDTFSPHMAMDCWISQIGYLAGIVHNCHEVYTFHNRFDLVGESPDEVALEREILDGNPDDPNDLNHPKQLDLKLEWVFKLNWFLKKIGQDPNWLDRALADPEFDIWSKHKENDINNQVMLGSTALATLRNNNGG